MIAVCVCNCGSSEQLARQTLEKIGYEHWFDIPVPKGKDKSLKMIWSLPKYKEIEALENYIKGASKWVVIVGINDNGCRWTDITHGGSKSNVEAKLIVQTFA